MGNKKKNVVFMIMTVAFIIFFTGTFPRAEVSAKASDFVIEDGVLKQYLGNEKVVVIPESVITIGKDAFKGNKLEQVVIPEGVTKIEDRAFQNCSKLTEIKLPESVTELGSSAFQGCGNLLRAELSSGLYGGMSAFEDCIRLKKVIIPDGVYSLSHYTFRNCSSLEIIDLPESISFIGGECFANCTSLETILFPTQDTYIGYKALFNTLWLDNYEGDYVIVNHTLIQYRGNESDITIPDHITIIGDGAFENCTFIKKVKIPSGVNEIGNFSFMGCTGLTKIVLPDSVKKVGASSFSGCIKLAKIQIPKDVNIRRDSLEETKWMSDYQGDFVILNGNLLSYKGKASNVVIPDTVATICTGAFHYNDIVKMVTVPESVTAIYYAGFSHCSNLKKIIISSKNIYLDYEAIYEYNKELKLYSCIGGAVNEYANSNHIQFVSYGINKTKVTLYLDGNNTATLTVNGIEGNVKWESKDTAIAKINQSGLITAVKTGTTRINASVNGITMSCEVTVEKPYITKSSITIKVGQTSRVNIIGVSQEITWSSNNTSVATVSSTGVVKANKSGSATITAVVNGTEYTCNVSVNPN